MGKGNIKNLLTVENTTPEQRRRNASKAGKASAKAQKKKRTMQETAKLVLNMTINSGDAEEAEYLLDLIKLDDDGKPVIGGDGKPLKKNLTVEQMAIMAQANKAIKGDVHALQFLRDTAGERPVEKVEVASGVAEAMKDIESMIAVKREKENGQS